MQDKTKETENKEHWINRKAEPHQLMDDHAQAQAYAESDFSEAHNAFVAHFKERFPDFSEGLALDIGCGDADPTIRFARAYHNVRLIGLDGSEAMLSFGRKKVDAAGLSEQIELRQQLLREDTFPPSTFDAVVCNSLLHHLDDPQDLWRSVKKIAKKGAPVFIMDLTRPRTEQHAHEIVDLYAKGAPDLMARDFFNSLLAAYRPQEVQAQLEEAGLSHFSVEKVSDRHLVIYGKI